MTYRNHKPGWATRQRLRYRDGADCQLCGQPLDFTLPWWWKRAVTIDHKIPRAAGGTDALDNLQLAHRICNYRKGANASLGADHEFVHVDWMQGCGYLPHPQANRCNQPRHAHSEAGRFTERAS